MSASQPPETSLTFVAYRKIRQAIMSNRLKPDTVISGSRLAKVFDMSRTPIREAIQILAQEGLVEIRNGVGFRVKAITLDELREISEVRVALECTAMRTAIKTVPVESVRELMDAWEQAKLLEGTDGFVDRIVELDDTTHRLITRNCNNSYLGKLLDSIELRIIRIQYMSVDTENALDTIDQHIQILRAMEQRDLALAEQLLHSHIQYSLRYAAEHEDFLSGGQSDDDRLKQLFEGE